MPKTSKSKLALVIMGPSGCGKTGIGSGLASDLGCPFLEGDSFHPESNISKMSSGIALSDSDRFPWLKSLSKEIERALGGREELNTNVRIIMACSALRKSYRDILRGSKTARNILFIYLECTKEELICRLESRKGHFMKRNMLESQLETFEAPSEEEIPYFFTFDGSKPQSQLISDIKHVISSLPD